MKRGRRTRWFAGKALVPALLIGLAACQSGTDVADVLDPGAAKATRLAALKLLAPLRNP